MLNIKDAVRAVRKIATTEEVVGSDTVHTPHHRDPEVIAALAGILAKMITEPATEASLAAILVKLSGDPSTAALQASANAKLDTIHVDLSATLVALLDGLEGGNAALLAKLSGDPATQTTLAAVLSKLSSDPATGAKQDAETAAVNRVGTRAYGTVERVAVGVASAQSAAIVATEVMLHASVKCYVLVGANPTAAPTTSIPLEAGEKFHLRITSGNKIAVIRDSADGFLHVVAVA